MRLPVRLLLLCALLLSMPLSYAGTCGCKGKHCPLSCKQQVCCDNMGGIQYCDSSAGRYVCNNGYYSSCYCTRHAIMDLQGIEGCCTWQGGVLAVTPLGLVLCNNGGVSEVCTGGANGPQSTSIW